MMTIARCAAAVILAALLSACGGGGDDMEEVHDQTTQPVRCDLTPERCR